MQEEGSLLPWQESYTVTYLDVGEEWITGSLVPTVVVQSGWEMWPEGARVIDVLARRTPEGMTVAHFSGSTGFIQLAGQVPPEIGDYSVFTDLSAAADWKPTYKLPWKQGDTWKTTKSWRTDSSHDAIDFAPQFGASQDVLSSETGSVGVFCPPDRDSRRQMSLYINHPNGKQTRYLHLSEDSVKAAFDGKLPDKLTIPQGKLLGSLAQNILPYDTGCGYGSGPHLHLVVPDHNIEMETRDGNEVKSTPIIEIASLNRLSKSTNTPCGSPSSIQVIVFSEDGFAGKCIIYDRSNSTQSPGFTIKSMRIGANVQAAVGGGEPKRGKADGDNYWVGEENVSGTSVLVKDKTCTDGTPGDYQANVYTERGWKGACQTLTLVKDGKPQDKVIFENPGAYELDGPFRSIKLGEHTMARYYAKAGDAEDDENGDRVTESKDVEGRSLRLLRRDEDPPIASEFNFENLVNGVVYSNDGRVRVLVEVEDEGKNKIGVESVTLLNITTGKAETRNADDGVYKGVIEFDICKLATPLRQKVEVKLSMVDKLDQDSSESRSATLVFPDVDGNCKVEVQDATQLIRTIFNDDGPKPDVNNDGRFDLIDVIATIEVVFGPAPSQPPTAAAATVAPLASAEPARMPVLEFVASTPLASDAKSVTLAGSRAYVAASFDASLHVLDLAADAPPVPAFSVPLNGTVATDVDIAGNRLFVTQPFKTVSDPPVTSLTTLDLPADGSVPTIIADYEWGIYARRIATDGTYAYVAGDESPLFRIYDVTDAAAPQLLADYSMQGRTSDLIVAGSTAFVTDDSVGILVFDVSNRSNPVVIGSLAAPGSQLRLAYQAPLLAITDRNGNIHIVNAANPAAPVLLSTIREVSIPKSSQIAGNLLLVAAGEEGVFAFDITNPAAPRLIGQYNTAENAQELAYQDGRIYVADGDSGLQTLAVHPECAGPYYTQFFADEQLSWEAFVYATCDIAFNHYWGEGGPGNGIGIDHFSARSTGKVAFLEGSYTFSAQADDGIRVYVDGSLVIDAWEVVANRVLDGAIYLTAGEHDIRVEYREAQGAAAYNVSWQPTPAPEVCLRANASLAQSYGGSFDERAQVQRFCVSAAANQWLSARAFAAADSTLDPSLQIYDPSGRLVAANDDGIALDLNAAVTYQAPADGVYQMAVANPSSPGGSFQVRAEAGRQASPADVDFNCRVETADLDLLNANLGSANPVYDVNLDGSVDAQDVEIVQSTLDVYGSGGVRCDGTIYAALTPDTTTKRVNPGASAVYVVTVFNAGTLATGFDVQVKSAGWPAAANVATLDPVAPDSSALFSVTVQVPNGAPLAAANDTVITVLPKVDPALARAATIQTIAAGSALPRASATASTDMPEWPVAALIDGQFWPVWSSWAHEEHLTGAEWAALGLAQRATVDRIRIHPRGNPNDPGNSLGFPKDLVLQYSFNGIDEFGKPHTCDAKSARYKELDNWRPFLALYGYDQPADEWIDFRFIPRQADCIRVFGAELSQDDYGARYMQFAEIEVYGK